MIHDEEFTGHAREGARGEAGALLGRRATTEVDTLDALIEGEPDDSAARRVPGDHTRIIILTSGTTGTPKGAPRNEAGIDAAISLLSRMPLQLRAGRCTSRRRCSTPGASRT